MRTRIFCPTGEVVPVGLFSCVSVENNAKNAFYLADDAATYGFYSFPGGFQHRLGYFYYFLRSPFDGLSYGGACHLAHYAADEAAYGGGAFTSLSSPVRMAERIIDAAEKIGQKEVKSFVLSGLSIAAAGYITEEQDRRILEVLKMTRIGEMIRKEIEEKVAESVAKSVAEGEKNARKETAGLMNFLLTNGRNDDALRATQDDNYLEKLLMDYRAGVLMAK